MGLFGPKWKSKKWVVRKKAVAKITDERILKELATTDPEFQVRQACITKIADQEFLKQQALSARDWRMRKLCVHQLSDKQCLLAIAKSNPEMDSKDSELLAILGMNEATNRLLGHTSALQETESIDALHERKKEYKKVIFEAAKKLTNDKALMYDIALHADSADLRNWIIEFGYLDDIAMLEDVIKNEQNKYVTETATERLQYVLGRKSAKDNCRKRL